MDVSRGKRDPRVVPEWINGPDDQWFCSRDEFWISVKSRSGRSRVVQTADIQVEAIWDNGGTVATFSGFHLGR